MQNIMQESIVKLETIVAFHEETIAQLSDIIYRQEQTQQALEKRITRLEQQVRDSATNASAQIPHEAPPHY